MDTETINLVSTIVATIALLIALSALARSRQ